MPQKYKIHYRHSFIELVDFGSTQNEGEAQTLLSKNSALKLIQNWMIESKQVQPLVLLVKNPANAFKRIKKAFKYVKAGGGIVCNGAERVLLIYRNNKWDLPKGKIEKGETLAECAVREVEEETGLRDLKRGHLIGKTYHIYRERERFVLKKTNWYLMLSTSEQTLTPQLNEGITKVKWFKRNKAAKMLGKSYRSLNTIFQEYIKQACPIEKVGKDPLSNR